MSTGRVWAIAIICMVVGVGLMLVLRESVGPARFSGQLSGLLLLIAPLGLAVNFTARRRRARRREDSPDSVEFQAAISARSGAFGDALLLSVLAMLALTVAPGSLPMLWSLLLVAAILTSFWIRYVVALRRMRA